MSFRISICRKRRGVYLLPCTKTWLLLNSFVYLAYFMYLTYFMHCAFCVFFLYFIRWDQEREKKEREEDELGLPACLLSTDLTSSLATSSSPPTPSPWIDLSQTTGLGFSKPSHMSIAHKNYNGTDTNIPEIVHYHRQRHQHKHPSYGGLSRREWQRKEDEKNSIYVENLPPEITQQDFGMFNHIYVYIFSLLFIAFH